MKLWFKSISIFLLICLLFYGIFVQWWLPNLIVKVNPWPVALMKGNPPEIKYSEKFNSEEFSFYTFDNLSLKGRIIHSEVKTDICVILVHGIRSCKENYFAMADFLAENGLNVICFDQRGHGESEGEYCTFGVKESKDINSMIEFARHEFGLQNFVLWGQSLGGAVVIQSMNKNKLIKAGIVESTFTNYKTISTDYIQNTLPVFPASVCKYSAGRGAVKANFDPSLASSLLSAYFIQKPMFIAHGSKDGNINPKYGQMLFAALPSSIKEFHEIEGARHHDLWNVGGVAYFEKVLTFINKILTKKQNN